MNSLPVPKEGKQTVRQGRGALPRSSPVQPRVIQDVATPRRERRFRCQLPVVIRVGDCLLQAVTQEVSYGGILVRCSSPVLRRRVEVEAVIPPENLVFVTHATCIYAVDPLDGAAPDVALQFSEMGAEQAIWDDFVHRIEALAGEVAGRPRTAWSTVRQR